jgi:hypothetical protein
VKRITRELAVLLFYFAGSIYFTYPLVTGLDRLVTDEADPLLNAWALSWDVRALSTSPGHLFDANIFHPETGTLAFSEHLLGVALLVAPVEIAMGKPILTHNVALLLLLTLSGYFQYRLTAFVTGSRAAGLAGGALFAFLPYRLGQFSHLQLQATAGFPLVFLGVSRYVSSVRIRSLVLLALSLVWLSLSCGYYGVFVWTALGLVAAFEIFRTGGKESRRKALGLAMALALSAAALLPLSRPYFRLERDFGFSRPLERVVPASARLHSYARSKVVWHQELGIPDANAEQTLFPGVTLGALSVLGLLVLDRRSSLYALVAGFGFWASLGPAGGLYSVLHAVVPGVNGLRVPARFSILVFFALSVLAGRGVRWLEEKLPRAKRFVLVLALLPLAETIGTDVPFRSAPVAPPGSEPYLAAEPDASPVLHLPMPFERERISENAVYMLWSTAHFRPMANGYSGFTPPSFYELAEALSTFPDDPSVELLRSRGVERVVLHRDRYLRARVAALEQAISSDGRFDEVFRDERSVVYRVTTR